MPIVSASETRFGQLFDERFQASHRCGVCNGEIIAATTGLPNMLWVGCSNRSHDGFERVRSYYELYRTGEPLPSTIIEGIKKREQKGKARQ